MLCCAYIVKLQLQKERGGGGREDGMRQGDREGGETELDCSVLSTT